MSKDHLEKKSYRKSPGRQYGYDYDPLRSRSGQSQGNSTRGRTSSSLTQRPDPRRTRQLMRKSILENKHRFSETDEEELEPLEQVALAQEVEDNTLYSRRYQNRTSAFARSNLPEEEVGSVEPEEDEAWNDDFDYVDPDLGYEEDLLDARMAYENRMASRSLRATGTRSQRLAPTEEDYEDDEEYYEEEYEEEPRRAAPPKRRKKKNRMTRRGLLVGAGAALVGGTAIAAYELGPKLPQAVGNVGANIEKQLQDAFNKGVAQGAAEARKEILTALDNLEGVSLDGAIAAARLTRVAYDVFVSPIVKFGATISADFLNSMLRAFKTARGWLAGAYQDNTTLQDIQKVMESWVGQVQNMPKQLDAITQTDLDGAQAYLRGLQQKINEEKAKLNNPQSTPTATPKK